MRKKNLDSKKVNTKFVEIVFPIPTVRSFYYSVPDELQDQAKVGVRAVAPVGNRVTTGYIINTFEEIESFDKEIKPIEDIIDSIPFFDENYLRFAQWVADYYFASLGEVLEAAVPYGSDVESQKIVQVDPEYLFEEIKNSEVRRKNYIRLLQILSEKKEHTYKELQKKLKKENLSANLNYYLNKLESMGLASIFLEKKKPIVGIKKEKLIELVPIEFSEFQDAIFQLEKRSKKQLDVLLALFSQKEKKMWLKELKARVNTTPQILKALQKKKLIKITEVEVKREYVELYQEKIKDIQLTEEQKRAIEIVSESINKEEFHIYLVHGVTASGKTQVYLELIEKVLNNGKNVIYLVPEISLTPQIIRRIKNRFGDLVGVLHSRLSLGERFDEWRSIVKQEYRIVIGPRSAVFAPIKNIGLVIVDEEHDSSYKQQDNSPFYNAKDVALIRAKFENAVAVLGSATPSLESYYFALQGKYTLIELKNRIDGASLPKVNIIDLKKEKEDGQLIGSFSQKLIDKIKDRLNKNEKVIILQNRRGFATYVMCPDCGYTEQCKNCSVTLTYHLVKKEYLCHYCGFSKKECSVCPACGSTEIRYRGIGTQRVEDELEQIISNAKIGRMDLDTTQRKYSYSKFLNDFSEGKYNVLLGTQMVAKGLDFPDVTLVGVISAESNMLIPDFRSSEKTFQLLMQVSGRAGRSKMKGEVAIQTYRPDHYVLEHVQNHDYCGFYHHEIIQREKVKYPPFYRLALIEFKSPNLNYVKRSAQEFFKFLKYDKNYMEVLGPAPAYISKLLGKYRWHIILKSKRMLDPHGQYLHRVIDKALQDFQAKVKKISGVRILVDIDPVSTI